MIRFIIVALLMTIVGTSSTARGQTYELSGGWTLPFNNLGDLARGGPSIRFTYVRTVSWFDKGQVVAWTGFSDHRGKDFGILEDVEETGVFDNKWGVQGIPLMVGARFKKPSSKAHIDLTAGLLYKRISIDFGTSRIGSSTGTDTDPAIGAHAGYTLSGSLGAWGGLVLSTNDWRYLTAGLSWRFAE